MKLEDQGIFEDFWAYPVIFASYQERSARLYPNETREKCQTSENSGKEVESDVFFVRMSEKHIGLDLFTTILARFTPFHVFHLDKV